MRLDSRSRLLLACLAAVVVLLGVVRLKEWFEGRRSVGGLLSVVRGSDHDTEAIPTVLALEVDVLQGTTRVFESDRNPFRFGVVEREAPPPPPPKPPAPVVKPPPPRVEVPAGPVPPSSDHLECIGTFGPLGRPIAVFRIGEQLLTVRRGDQIEEAFVVEEIGLESVAIGFVDRQFAEVEPRRIPVGRP